MGGRVVGFVLALAAVTSDIVSAQSIEPPIVTLEGRAKHGQLVIANGSLFPLSFVLEPLSFVIGPSGELVLLPLDTARIHLRLTAMSGRVPPRQRQRIAYAVTADSLPSWFAIVVSFNEAAPIGGLVVRLQMTQIVYLNQRGAATAADIALEGVTFDSLSGVVRARIVNHSAKLTRLSSLRLVTADGRSFAVDAGPIFPNHTTEFVHRWTERGVPTTAVAAFTGFSLSSAIGRAASPSPLPQASPTAPLHP